MAGQRLSFGTKIFYGFGSVAYGVKDQGFQTFLLLYYNQVLGMPAIMVTSALMIALLIDAFIDPVIGQVSDNWRSKWGRRHPFMYAAALPYAAGFYFLWNPPTGLDHAATFAFMLGALLTIRLFDSFYELPSQSLAPELAPDYNERTALISLRWLFGLVSGIVMLLLAYQVFMRSIPGDPDSGILAREGYQPFALAGAAIIFVTILLSAWGTHGQIKHLRPAPTRKITIFGLIGEIIATLANRNFAILTAAGMLGAIALGVYSGLALYFGLYLWGFSQDQLTVIALGSVGAGVLGVSIVTPVTTLLGKKPTALACFALSLVVGNTAFAGRLLGLLPPPGSSELFWIILSLDVVNGALAVITMISVSSMIADVVEESEVKTGRRSEGLLFSADNFFKKLVSGVGVMVAGLILSVVEFPTNARPGQVPEETLTSMIFIFMPTTVVIFLAAFFTIFFFSIDKAAHDENLRKLRVVSTPAE